MDRERFLAVTTYLVEENYILYPADIENNIIRKTNGWFIPAIHQHIKQQRCWIYIPNDDFDFATMAAIRADPQIYELGLYTLDYNYLAIQRQAQTESPSSEDFQLWDQWFQECSGQIPFWLANTQSQALRLAWATDIHLNFLEEELLQKFYSQIIEYQVDGLFITGDIAESQDLIQLLQNMEQVLKLPIYFVLGNHDYYCSSIAEVHEKLKKLCQEIPHLIWLDQAGVVRINANTALIGHNGWADLSHGDYMGSDVIFTDYFAIRDLSSVIASEPAKIPRMLKLPEVKLKLQSKLKELSNEAAQSLRKSLLSALAQYQNIILLTHIPPFVQATTFHGRMSNKDWLPHLTCRAIGDMLLDVMAEFPTKQLLVLCGHTHGMGACWITDNILVLTGSAEYAKPKIQHVFEFAH